MKKQQENHAANTSRLNSNSSSGRLNHLFLVMLILAALVLTKTAFPQKAPIFDTLTWGNYFKEAGLEGTFVLLDSKQNQLYTYNSNRADIQYLPASTFKIINTLIGLQNGSVSNIDEVFKWDGTNRSYEAWNRDLSLREAFRVSAVWVYQELARRTGRPIMEEWLHKCRYGNQLTGKEIDSFWLDGDIAISAMEQIGFLNSLYFEKLPFTKKVQQDVKQIMLADSVPGKRLYAKTGWAVRIEHQIGWYVGFVEDENNAWIFALNIDIKKQEDTNHRIGITRKILNSEGIYPGNW
jgi:beta-lactamase class D